MTFRYGRHAVPVIDRLDLTIPLGDHLAVVGPSGVGKSTLAELIAGRLRPDAGELRLDGVPLRRAARRRAARQRVLIPQEAYVFTGSLWENLTYLRPDATRRQVDAAVHALGVAPLVARLGGYQLARRARLALRGGAAARRAGPGLPLAGARWRCWTRPPAISIRRPRRGRRRRSRGGPVRWW